MRNFILLSVFVGLIAFASNFVPMALAAVTCTTQYGGGQTCVSTGQLLINKKVYNPASKQMVDNLNPQDYQFGMGEEVTFSIDVKNVGDATLNNIDVKDILPNFLTLSGGELNSKVDSLTPGQIRTFTVKAKVNSNGTGCALNTATATTSGASDSDTAQVCIKGEIPPEMPKAGPEFILLAIPFSGLGLILKKYSK